MSEQAQPVKGLSLDFFSKLAYPASMLGRKDEPGLFHALKHLSVDENKAFTDLYLSDAQGLGRLTRNGRLAAFYLDGDGQLLFSQTPAKKDDDPKEDGPKKTAVHPAASLAYDYYAEDVYKAMEAAFKRVESKEPEDEPLGAFTRLWRLDLASGALTLAAELPLALSSLQRIAEGLYLVGAPLDLNAPDFYRWSLEERKAYAKTCKERSFYEHVTEIPFYFDGASYLKQSREQLYLWQEDTGRIIPLMDRFEDLASFHLTEDKKRLYVAAEAFESKRQYLQKLYRYELRGAKNWQEGEPLTERSCLYADQVYDFGALFEVQGQVRALASDHARFGLNESEQLLAFDEETGQFQRLNEAEILPYSSVNSDLAYGASSSLLFEAGTVTYLSTEDDHSVIRSIDEKGQIQTLYAGASALNGLALSQGRIYAQGQVGGDLPRIYRLEGTALLPIDALNEALAEKQNFRPVARFQYGDAQLNGYVILPEGQHPDRSLPAILNIHGGPRTVYGQNLFHEMQYWASQGYAVFYCNPRGSDGRGDAFADIRGQYGGQDYQDIMAVVDEVLERYPVIDHDRVGVTGGSYGGFMTNWIIGHTDRFACAATQRSISNWVSFYGCSDIGHIFAFDQNGADGFSQGSFAKLWEHSPLRYLKGASTPTLVIHSDQDYRCPLEQGMQVFTALTDLGVPSELQIFKEESHGLSRTGKPKARIERLARITAWMDRYLKR